MFIDSELRPPRRRISAIYALEAHGKRRRPSGCPPTPPPPDRSGGARRNSERDRRRRRGRMANDAAPLVAALRQLARGARVLHVADEALSQVGAALTELRAAIAPEARGPLSGVAPRPSTAPTVKALGAHAHAQVEAASFEGRSLFGAEQPAVTLPLGRVTLSLDLVDLRAVTRGLPALDVASVEAAAAACAHASRRVAQGRAKVAQWRVDLHRIVDGYRHAQRALRGRRGAEEALRRRVSPRPPTPAPTPETFAMADEVRREPARAVSGQATSTAAAVLHRLR
ncbi:MAG: hypothetical protein AAF928_18510 [Myxococcota bacterium]